MTRTQIQLEDHQHRQLRQLGHRTGKGLAEQIREAVTRYLRQEEQRAGNLEEVLGRFPPLPAGGADLKAHDRAYSDTLR